MQSPYLPCLLGNVLVLFELPNNNNIKHAGIVDVVVCQVGKVSFRLQIDMDALSGAAHGRSEQEMEEALREAERSFMAEIDPNALHPAESSNGTLFLRRE